MAAAASASLLALVVLGLGVCSSGSNGSQCLLWPPEGCQSIIDEAECRNSCDGPLNAAQPCAWCDGEACANNSDALCWHHDWVKECANISVADCGENETRQAKAATVEATTASNGTMVGGVAAVTTTLVDQVLRFMTDNETLDNLTNESVNDSLVFLGGTESSDASWIWWLAAAAAAVLVLVAVACYCALSDSTSSCGLDEFDSDEDEESLTATSCLEVAPQRPVLLSRAPPRVVYKQLEAAKAYAEPVATQQAAPFSHVERAQNPATYAAAAGGRPAAAGLGGSARSFVMCAPAEPAAAAATIGAAAAP